MHPVAGGDGGVTRLELFLDLVFVYAFLSVTNLMDANLRPEGLLQGVLVTLLLWRCWASYTWLANAVRVDRGVVLPVMFGAAATLLVIAVAIPETFTDRPGGLFGPLVFAVGYVVVRSGALLMVTWAKWGTKHGRGPALRAWLPLSGSAALLLCAALLPGHLPAGVKRAALRLILYVVATAVDAIGIRALGAGSWQIASVRHWAERHRLVILIALGETIISIGTSRGMKGGPPITWSVIVGSLEGIVVVAVLWWSYFDIAGNAAERALERLSGTERSILGRDAYSLLHLPMIIGLTMLALGLKRALSSTQVGTAHRWTTLSTVVLYGGVVLYLLGLFAFERRTIRLTGRSPLLGIVVVGGLLPLAVRLPVVAALGLLAAAVATMVIADRTVFRVRHRSLHKLVAAVQTRAGPVTPKELFFDLMFAYSFIQVTVLMTRHPSAVGVAQGLAVLALLWWGWCGYASLANTIRSESGLMRLGVLLLVALLLVLGIATPQAFDRVPGGIPGPILVVTCYVAIRLLHLAGLALLTRRDPASRAPVRWAAVPILTAQLLLLVAALTSLRAHGPGAAGTAAVGLWLTAVVVDLGGGYLVGPRGWQVRSVEHWTDRYALIMVIAFGEAVTATGVAAAGLPISAPVIVAIVMSTVLLATLWQAYFQTGAVVAHRTLRASAGGGRAAGLARDAYTYLHLPMVAGLVLFALGVRTLEPVRDQSEHGMYLGHVTVYLGVIVYLVADQAFWWRIRHEVRWPQVCGVLLAAALLPATTSLSALWALAILAAVGLTISVVDWVRSGDMRADGVEPAMSVVLGDFRSPAPTR